MPRIDIFKFNFDTDPARIDKASAEINASSTDWSAFRKRNAKLILYIGMSVESKECFPLCNAPTATEN